MNPQTLPHGFKILGTEIVGPAVGQELRTKGIWATVLSLIGILAYIAFRFQFSFALGAVAATIHDLLVTLAFLAFFQYDLTLNVIAALLTITGFSTNDTIVIFDRVRENLRGMRRDTLDHVINVAINQTLGRTIITSGTALLSSIALLALRRRRAARFCVHHGRGHHHRHLFDGVHRRGDRQLLARQGADESGRARAGDQRLPRRRSSRRANRSRSGRRGLLRATQLSALSSQFRGHLRVEPNRVLTRREPIADS